MQVVIAADKFKSSVSSAHVAHALSVGYRRGAPEACVLERPIGDGGDGTISALLRAGFRARPAIALGASAAGSVQTSFAYRGSTAVIEVAEVAGLARNVGTVLNPLDATTYGVGEVITAALDEGFRTIVLAVGGSATTDGGIGMLQALGVRVLDRRGYELQVGMPALTRARGIDVRGLDPRAAETEFLLAADVVNPLLGERGAARVFGPQKGAGPAEVTLLEAALEQWAQVVDDATGTDGRRWPGAGAGGGIGFAALTLLNARFSRGIDVMIELTGLAEAVHLAELVVTGEGSLDQQSLEGKAPIGVAELARAAGVPVVAVAGVCSLTLEQTREAGFRTVYTLSSIEPDRDRSMSHAGKLLDLIGETIARDHLLLEHGAPGPRANPWAARDAVQGSELHKFSTRELA